MRRSPLVALPLLAAALVVTAAPAQEERPIERIDPKPTATAPATLQTGEPGKPAERRTQFDHQVFLLRERLKLNDDQRKKFDEILSRIKERHSKGGVHSQRDERLALMRELAEANKAGDAARIQKVKDRVAQLDAKAEEGREDRAERLVRELEPILNAEQKEELAAFRKEQRGPKTSHALVHPEAMLQVAEKLNLSGEQKKKLDAARAELAQDLKAYSPEHPLTRSQIAMRVEKAILAILTDDQSYQYHRRLDRMVKARNYGRDAASRYPEKTDDAGDGDEEP